MKIDIIIPNFNGSHLIKANLAQVVESHESFEGEIIIVDDGSKDQDVGALETFLSKENYKKVRLVKHRENQGFSSAINTGVKSSSAYYVVLLNSDVFPRKDFLTSLVKKMNTDEKLFGLGCMDESIEDGKIVRRGRGLGYWKKGMLLHKRGEVDREDTFWVSGGSCILRRELFEKLGGMDTVYNPFYWEDIDLSYRARKAGYEIGFLKESIVKHYHEEGAIKKSFSKTKISRIAYRNQFIFIWKNISDVNYLLNHIFFLPINIVGAIKRGDFIFIEGLFLALKKLFVIIKKRRKQKALYLISDADLLAKIS